MECLVAVLDYGKERVNAVAPAYRLCKVERDVDRVALRVPPVGHYEPVAVLLLVIVSRRQRPGDCGDQLAGRVRQQALVLLVNPRRGHLVIVNCDLLEGAYSKLARYLGLVAADVNIKPIIVLKILHEHKVILVVDDPDAHVGVPAVKDVVSVAVVAAFLSLYIIWYCSSSIVDSGSISSQSYITPFQHSSYSDFSKPDMATF